MSFFPRAFPSGDFAPLFRLLDDYDQHRTVSPRGNGNGSIFNQSIRTFQPRFDVKEVKDGYELHGELPGIDQKDINIEFTDPQTLVIKGRTEREYSSGTPPASIEAGKSAAQITEAGEGEKHSKYHKASVEEEEPSTPASTQPETQLEKTESATTPAQTPKEQSKYWVSERSIGEFHRSFSFPSRVDQDAVRASLKNGILSIVVPKAAAPTSRKINIE